MIDSPVQHAADQEESSQPGVTGRKGRGVWKGVAQPFVAAGVSSFAAAEDTGAAATADRDSFEVSRWAFMHTPLSGKFWLSSYRSRKGTAATAPGLKHTYRFRVPHCGWFQDHLHFLDRMQFWVLLRILGHTPRCWCEALLRSEYLTHKGSSNVVFCVK